MSVIDLTQEQAFNLLDIFSRAEPPPVEQPGQECEDCMGCCERYNAATGRIQRLVCSNWEDLPGYPSGSSPAGQPGNGSPQPPPGGGQACYDITFTAVGQGLIPTFLNAGDQIIVQESDGAIQDNAGFWWNPDGTAFILGGSYNNIHTDASDRAPTLRHGAIVVLIAGTYYLAYAGQTITVPGGVSNATATVMPNITPAGGNGGDFHVNLCVVNNQAAPWCDFADFALSAYGFVGNVAATQPSGHWVSGTGFDSDLFQEPAGNYYRGVDVTLALPSSHVKHIDFTYDLVAGSCVAPSDHLIDIEINGTEVAFTDCGTVVPGTGKKLVWDGDISGVTSIRLFAAGGYGPSDPGGSTVLRNVTVSGINGDPAFAPHC